MASQHQDQPRAPRVLRARYANARVPPIHALRRQLGVKSANLDLPTLVPVPAGSTLYDIILFVAAARTGGCGIPSVVSTLVQVLGHAEQIDAEGDRPAFPNYGLEAWAESLLALLWALAQLRSGFRSGSLRSCCHLLGQAPLCTRAWHHCHSMIRRAFGSVRYGVDDPACAGNPGNE